ncbi:bifunctional alpha,alpha-trehalose-phosphate synthase (UDP-forming)/trehalose-phosphatase [Arachidicoccus terrestris]|uniref:bifunctional alpha,alpha-trehalose-phosphate synthase (UDP-forming)/trehalose-phosphatase n=1 Tax=Arachidicoccus terrestris TaxID=2875539 RepID=UPI001CC65FD3|nr:bifunctional alpha,alpha-trehalose-phosphate synthase (UDP-forming)/trehalose-phosphatase [Arachidicoccus terrestris]UAY55917.1 bifunctional alpha,alpha-trehalose-phosphate synthase (UDP-forming)/trehalose-phosphatase [Arachidicoccus terrestris]
MNKAKLIIVSNRLPVKIDIKKNQWHIKPSEGGLATGLGSFYKEQGGIWIGWPGAQIKDASVAAEIRAALNKQSLEPIFLTQTEIKEFYEGFSNQTLWPLCHYFPSYASYNEKHWQVYQSVNQKFADAILNIARPGDTVWIHDYQLMLVPKFVRERLPDISIGYFQHIPFPSYEVFRLIPWRNELLTGLLGADLVGFHTYDDVRHFVSAILRILDVQSNMNIIEFAKRLITAEAFPMGIDYDKYFKQVSTPVTRKYAEKILERLEEKKLVISIDRLDYSKGIIQRLHGYNIFLRDYPHFRGKVVYYQLIVPSRDKVLEYDRLKQEIDQLVSHINAEYSTLSWQPIQYFYRAWAFEMLSALYYTADIALVTPMRDGMNLVCKEYIASKADRPGVLILSEMAGAARELTEATIINPNDEHGMAEAIATALQVPQSDQVQRLKAMQQTLNKFNIHVWVNNFLMRLMSIKQQQVKLATKRISAGIETEFQSRYQHAKSRLCFLDYDGTLVSFEKDPQMAIPTERLLKILQRLTQDKKNRIVIISGRKKQQLENWLKGLDLDIIAEHGAWYRSDNGQWQKNEELRNYWKKDIRPVLEQYEIRTPGSFIEEKDFSLVWHYRKVESSLGDLRAKEIAGHLKYLVADKGLQILEGHKVIEVKSALINKGKGVQKWLKKYPADFYLAIGDDTTDEDSFAAMPPTAITIKVGGGMSRAAYFIDSPTEVIELLEKITQPLNPEPTSTAANSDRSSIK